MWILTSCVEVCLQSDIVMLQSGAPCVNWLLSVLSKKQYEAEKIVFNLNIRET